MQSQYYSRFVGEVLSFFLYQSRKLSFEFDTHNSGIPLAKLFHFGTVKIKGLHHDSGRKINPLHKYRFTVKHV